MQPYFIKLNNKNLEFEFGVGGDFKKNSSSWILRNWQGPLEYRPWGWFRIIDDSDDHKIKLIDFGVAKFADQKLTATGLVMGSPHYMSPEQWRGQKIDQRSDIWAVGALLYEMLSGDKAFVGETRVDVAIQVFEAAPKTIVFSDIDGAERKRAQQLEMISLKALRKAPDERYQDCSELLKELQSIG